MMLEEFLKTYHLDILKEFERSLLPWSSLKVGTIVVTLRAGFCGGSGELRKVTELITDNNKRNYAVLENLFSDDKSLLYECYLWWKDVAIIDNEHYNTLDWRGKEKYLKELTALNF